MQLDNVEDVYALTPLQAGMLYHAIAEPNTGVFVNQIVTTVTHAPGARFDPAVFARAWHQLIDRHTILRTAFLWDGLDEPLQVVRQQVSLPWEHVDWRDATPRDDQLAHQLRDDRLRGFDLADAPLIRMTLGRIDNATWHWVWTFHHLLLDGWSARLLLTELEQVYGALTQGASPSPAPAFEFGSYVAWHARQDRDAAERFWRRNLGDLDDATRFDDPLATTPVTDANNRRSQITGSPETRSAPSGARHRTRTPEDLPEPKASSAGRPQSMPGDAGTVENSHSVTDANNRRSQIPGNPETRNAPGGARHRTRTPEDLSEPKASSAGRPQSVPGDAGTVESSHQITHHLNAQDTEDLTRFAAGHQLTLSTVIQGAWAQVLGRHARRREVVFGVTMTSRPPELAGVERAIGLFINTLPARVDLAPSTPVATWLQGLQRDQLAAQAYVHSPLDAVQRWSGAPAGEALFDSIVVFENQPTSSGNDDTKASTLALGEPRFIEQSNYPLALLVVPGPQLELILVHDPRRLGAGSAERLLHRVTRILTAFVEAPGRPVGDRSMIDADKQERLRAYARGDTARVPAGARIQRWILDAAAARPDLIAVITDDGQLTYGALATQARRLAAHLRTLGVAPGTLVGLHATRSLELVVGLVGILEAGGAYVPLDPTYPADHLRFIAEDTALRVVLTDRASPSPFAARNDTPPPSFATVRLDEPTSWDDPLDGETSAPLTLSDDDLAYVIHTSGSSGTPKGVMVSHGNLAHATLPRLRATDDPPRRFLLLSSFAFDSSVAGLLGTLCSGDTLVLPAPGAERDLDAIHDLVRRHRVTNTLCLPTLYGLLLDETDARGLATLETVIVAGEACPPRLAQRHHATLPNARLINEYGPTEATVWSTVHTVTAADAAGPVPIGRPIAGSRAHVLDDRLRPVPVGVPGELYMAGPGVARGYVGDPRRTAERFVPLPMDDAGSGPTAIGARAYRTGDLVCWRPDGHLLFLGRADSQIKIRGHRLEPEGVAALLRQHLGASDAAVVLDTQLPRPRLVAYLTTPDGEDSSTFPANPRAALDGVLPAFMVPDAFVVLPRLPRRPNGKLDTAALPSPDDTRNGRDPAAPNGDAPPRTETEDTIAAIWSALLGIESVGPHDNFHALGGDSILAIQLVSRLRQAGLAIEPRHLAQHPTVAALARVAEEAAAENIAATDDATAHADSLATVEPIAGAVPLLPIQTWFLERDLTSPAWWNHSRCFALPSNLAIDVDLARLERVLAACVQHHDMLRARFHRDDDGTWQQHVVAPEDSPVPLEIVDLPTSATPADRAAHIARTQAALDLANGPLIRALVLRGGPSDDARLLLAVHHLVIDAVSWSVLGDDVARAYAQDAAGEAIVLPPPTASYRDWAANIAEHVRADGTAETGPEHSLEPADYTLPTDHTPETEPSESDAATVRVKLGSAHTTALVGPALVAHNSRVDELLITALALVFQRWRERDTWALDLEGHGRSAPGVALDVSRTVGWFTTAFPVTLTLPTRHEDDTRTLGDAIEAMRDQLRPLRSGGVLQGWQRPDETPTPSVLFNYLSRLDTSAAVEAQAAVPRMIDGGFEGARDPRNARAHRLEINVAVRDGELAFDWIHARTVHDTTTIERLGREVISTLEGLVEHCMLGEPGHDGRGFPFSELHRLTEVQEALLLHHLQHDAARDGGFLLLTGTLDGALDLALFKRAWHHTLTRHPALHSAVRWRDLPHPLQVVAANPDLPIHHEDWRSLNDATQSKRWQEWCAGWRRDGIDLQLAPVSRVALVRTGDDRHRMAWACHHLLLDGWSCARVLDDLLDAYRRLHAPETGQAGYRAFASPAPPPFRAYVDAVRGHDLDPALFWRDTPLRPRDLTQGRLAPSASGSEPRSGSSDVLTSTHAFTDVTAEHLDAWARLHRVTAGCLFAGCWGLTIAEATEHDRAVFGLTVSGRTVPIEGIESMVGMCANALPMAVDHAPDAPRSDWFRGVLETLQSLQPFEHVALGGILRAGGYTRPGPPFDSLLAFANYPVSTDSNSDIEDQASLVLRDFEGDMTSAYPLTLAVTPGDPYTVTVHVDGTQLATATADALVQRFIALVQSALVQSGSTEDASPLRLLLDTASVPAVSVVTPVDSPRPTKRADAKSPPEAPGSVAEGQLMRIWNDLIAFQEIGPDDNFFHLGGHSLLVPPMIERIERDLGVTLPLAAVFAQPTIRALAAAIADRGHAPDWPSLVAIRDQGDRSPLFLVHGLGGEVSWFYNLATHLPGDLPLLGLQAPAEPFDDLPAMARHYLGELRARQPSGPYYLGGYCAGGCVAFEMARQLRAAGEEVAFLLLIDSVPQSHAEGAPVALPAMLYRRVKHLLSKNPAEILRSTRDAARRAGKRLEKRDPDKPVELSDVLDMTTLPRVYHHAAKRHFRAVRDYQPVPHDGDMWLFRTHDPRFGEDFGWGALTTGTLHVERVEGTHIEVLKEPHVTGLGRKLAAALATVTKGDVP